MKSLPWTKLVKCRYRLTSRITKEAQKSGYQTVYAKKLGSAAAPTAGLHFTDELIENISLKGIEIATVELTIGIDTFQPITVSDSADHVMHSESLQRS